MRLQRSVMFLTVLLLASALIITSVNATETFTLLASETSATTTDAFSNDDLYSESVSVRWIFTGMTLNVSQSGATFGLNLVDTDSIPLALSIVPDTETYYIDDDATVIASAVAIPTSANWFVKNATYEISVSRNIVTMKINGVAILTDYSRSGTGNFTSVQYTDDHAGHLFTAGYASIKVYPTATSASFDSLIAVIIMVSVISILIGAIKVKKR